MVQNSIQIDRIERFNPHNMKDEDILHLATGRDAKADILIKRFLALARGKLMPPTHRHAMVMGPRGIGKSFFLRLIQARIQKYTSALPFVLLPEENYNIRRPQDLLINVRARLLGESIATTPRKGGDRDDWLRALDDLLETLNSVCAKGGQKPPYLIIGLENFDRIVRSAFAKPQQESLLRDLVEGDTPISFLVSTLRGDIDTQSKNRFFHAFDHIRLDAWSDSDFLDFFEKSSTTSTKVRMAKKVRAIATFTGGSPRMGVILSDLAQHDDPLSVAETLNALVDWLTPYYQNILDNIMPDKSRHLFDALLRDGEPESQTGLAKRLGETQADYAQAFNWLEENEYLYGEREIGGRAILYKVGDRVFAQYYRQRLGLFGDGVSTLELLTELLAAYYTSQEVGRHAQVLFDANRYDDAAVLARIKLSKEGLGGGTLQKLQSDLLGRIIATDELKIGKLDGSKVKEIEDNLIAFRLELDQLPKTDVEQRATLLSRIGSCLFFKKEWQEFLDVNKEACVLYRNFGAIRSTWNCEQRVARALTELGRIKDAHSHISALLEEIENYSGEQATNLLASQAGTLLFAGWISRKDKDIEVAESYYSRAEDVALAAGDHNISSEVSLLYSDLLLDNQDFSGALRKAKSAIKKAQTVKNTYYETRATLSKTRVFLALKEPKSAIEAANRTIFLARKKGYGLCLRGGYFLSSVAKQALGDERSAQMDALKALSTSVSLGDEKYQLHSLARHALSFQKVDKSSDISALKNILTDEEFRPFLSAHFCEILIKVERPDIAPDLIQILLTIGKNSPDNIKEFEVLQANIRLYGKAFGAFRQQETYKQALRILAEYEHFLQEIGKLSIFPEQIGEDDWVMLELYRASTHLLAHDTNKMKKAVVLATNISETEALSQLSILTNILSSQWKGRDRVTIFSDGMLIYNSIIDALVGSEITHEEILVIFLASLFEVHIDEPVLRDIVDELIDGEDETHKMLRTAVGAALRYRTAKADAASKEKGESKKKTTDPKKILQRLDPDVATTVRILVGEEKKEGVRS